MIDQLRTATMFTIVSVALLGFVYPVTISGIAHIIAAPEADGSLMRNTRGEIIGTALAGQIFTKPEYFHGRPSAAGSGYDALASSGTNLGPTSKKLLTATHGTIDQTMLENQTHVIAPADLVSSSASGLDPDISPASAAYQIERVARARKRSRQAIEALVARYTAGRDFGILGEPRVHVLSLNLALDAQAER